MKSVICIVFFLTVSITLSFASTARGDYNDPKNPGKCTISEDLILSPGDQVKNPNIACGRILCGYNGMAEFQTCGKQMKHGCTQGDYLDKSLPYPDCCRRQWIC